MATTQKAASPQKKNQGFQGIRAAFWVIVVCLVIAICIYNLLLGNPSNFAGNDPAGHPTNLLGTIYKGGIVVPVIHTLLLTVIALSIERWLALNTAFGKGSLLSSLLTSRLPLLKATSMQHSRSVTSREVLLQTLFPLQSAHTRRWRPLPA